MTNSFSDFVSGQIGNYVYRLVDPRSGMTFYVGRGKGNRVFQHADGVLAEPGDEDEDDLKLKTIREIKRVGLEVQHIIHRHGLDDAIVREVEGALIDAYAGLTNLVKGEGSGRGVMHAS